MGTQIALLSTFCLLISGGPRAHERGHFLLSGVVILPREFNAIDIEILPVARCGNEDFNGTYDHRKKSYEVLIPSKYRGKKVQLRCFPRSPVFPGDMVRDDDVEFDLVVEGQVHSHNIVYSYPCSLKVDALDKARRDYRKKEYLTAFLSLTGHLVRCSSGDLQSAEIILSASCLIALASQMQVESGMGQRFKSVLESADDGIKRVKLAQANSVCDSFLNAYLNLNAEDRPDSHFLLDEIITISEYTTDYDKTNASACRNLYRALLEKAHFLNLESKHARLDRDDEKARSFAEEAGHHYERSFTTIMNYFNENSLITDRGVILLFLSDAFFLYRMKEVVYPIELLEALSRNLKRFRDVTDQSGEAEKYREYEQRVRRTIGRRLSHDRKGR